MNQTLIFIYSLYLIPIWSKFGLVFILIDKKSLPSIDIIRHLPNHQVLGRWVFQFHFEHLLEQISPLVNKKLYGRFVDVMPRDFSKCLWSRKELSWIFDLLKNSWHDLLLTFGTTVVPFIIITEAGMVEQGWFPFICCFPTLMVLVGDSVSKAWRSSPTVALVKVDHSMLKIERQLLLRQGRGYQWLFKGLEVN